MRKRNAFTVFELCIVMCTVTVLLGTFGIYSAKIIIIARQVALQSELVHLRTALAYYQILHNTYPAQLQDLAKNTLTTPLAGGKMKFEKYITPCRVNTRGYFLDPIIS